MESQIYDLTTHLVIGFHYGKQTIFISYHKGSGMTSTKKVDDLIYLSGSLRDMDIVQEFVHNLNN